MRILRKLAARVALAFTSVLPASQAPATDPATREKTRAVRADKFDESEVETGCAPWIFTDSSKYTGLRASLGEQLIALEKAKGRGIRFLNSSLMGDRLHEERERFIASRMRDIG